MLGLALAVALAAVHVLAGRLRVLDRVPRSAWLSGAGGASVAYVFVHLLPELAASQETLAASAGAALEGLEAHAWLLALLGLAVFYGLERAAVRSRAEEVSETGRDQTEPGVFWLHMGFFAVYNAIIGYLLLHREDPGVGALLVYASAMALHFLVNDYGLREHHRALYDRIGRWVLGAAVIGGCLLGTVTRVGEPALAMLVAFLGGAVVLNVLKEELPDDRKSRFSAFLLGVTAFGALLLAL